MLIYSSNKAGFRNDVGMGVIDSVLQDLFMQKMKRRIAERELDAFWNSLHFMSDVIEDKDIPDSAGVSIECHLPQTSKRIDFIITGKDADDRENVVIIELKQWSKAQRTNKDGIVTTILGGGLHETNHPSYQAYSYAAFFQDFSQTVEDEKIQLVPCAYLHNYEADDVIRHPFYKPYLEKAPVFLKREKAELRDFIKQYVKKGDHAEIMYRIVEGKIRPSKQLSDALSGMLKGKKEFILLDEQKLVYETALDLTQRSSSNGKQVFIVQGGPGTGKSVVAINLLVEITKRNQLVHYVSKNAAPRAVYQSKLTGQGISKARFSSMFRGSGNYIDSVNNQFDALVVDEAHRLNEKSGMYQNLGENQIKELINSARCSIFFIDEDQRIALKDIGSNQEIRKWAEEFDAEVTEMELSSQFRCNGSDGYLAFLDNTLQIRETANHNLDGVNYDFRVVDSPNALRDLIFEKNKKNNSARLVAGYCWDWNSRKDLSLKDIVIPEYDFAMKWNLDTDSSLWIIKPNSVQEVGCIHTCQGLEVDYVGVIIGEDLIVRNGEVLVDPSKRSKNDSTIKGYKQLLKANPEAGKQIIKSIIKNTYRTLMTRGMKGCYVWCVDEETKKYFIDTI